MANYLLKISTINKLLNIFNNYNNQLENLNLSFINSDSLILELYNLKPEKNILQQQITKISDLGNLKIEIKHDKKQELILNLSGNKDLINKINLINKQIDDQTYEEIKRQVVFNNSLIDFMEKLVGHEMNNLLNEKGKFNYSISNKQTFNFLKISFFR